MENSVGMVTRSDGEHRPRRAAVATMTIPQRRKDTRPPPYTPPGSPLTVTPNVNINTIEVGNGNGNNIRRREGIMLPPWFHGPTPYPQTEEGLTMELKDFVDYICLTEAEVQQRRELIATVQGVVGELWGDISRVFVYGSFALGLSIPSSDVDLTVLFDDDDSKNKKNNNSSPTPTTNNNNNNNTVETNEVNTDDILEVQARRLRRLHQLAHRLAGVGFRVRVFDFCRVPVVNLRDPFTGISCDISVSGLTRVAQVVERQRAWLANNKGARELILVTKAALKQWGLNSLFHGGLSSTALYMLVRRFIAQEPQHPDVTYNNNNNNNSKEDNNNDNNNNTSIEKNRESSYSSSTSASVSSSSSTSCSQFFTARRLLNFWRYASSEVFLSGYGLQDAFAVSEDEESDNENNNNNNNNNNIVNNSDRLMLTRGNADLSAGSYRLPEVLALFRHSSHTLSDIIMLPHSLARFTGRGLSSVFADPRGGVVPVVSHNNNNMNNNNNNNNNNTANAVTGCAATIKRQRPLSPPNLWS